MGSAIIGKTQLKAQHLIPTERQWACPPLGVSVNGNSLHLDTDTVSVYDPHLALNLRLERIILR